MGGSPAQNPPSLCPLDHQCLHTRVHDIERAQEPPCSGVCSCSFHSNLLRTGFLKGHDPSETPDSLHTRRRDHTRSRTNALGDRSVASGQDSRSPRLRPRTCLPTFVFGGCGVGENQSPHIRDEDHSRTCTSFFGGHGMRELQDNASPTLRHHVRLRRSLSKIHGTVQVDPLHLAHCEWELYHHLGQGYEQCKTEEWKIEDIHEVQPLHSLQGR